MNYCHRSARCGASLVETLVIIAVGAVVLAGVASGTNALLAASNRLASADNDRRLLIRVSRQMREDLHDAQAAEWNADEQRLSLTMPNTPPVVYAVATGRINRVSQQHTTPYRVPDGCVLQCAATLAKQDELIEMSLTSSKEQARVVAWIGRDNQLPAAPTLGETEE